MTVSMLSLFANPNNPLLRNLEADHSASDVFIPFQVDSFRNEEMEALFKGMGGGLTRYRCTNCRKHIIWVGECGGVNFGKTTKDTVKWPCPVCGITIGQHEQY